MATRESSLEEAAVTEIHAGQRYRALSDLEVGALAHWRAPFTGGHEVTLPVGEVFRIAYDPPEGATAASCDPERYEELHSILIPEEDRRSDQYASYSLVISFEWFATAPSFSMSERAAHSKKPR